MDIILVKDKNSQEKTDYVSQYHYSIVLVLYLAVMAIITHGATVVMIELFDPLMVLAAVQKEKCTALYGVPTMFIAEFSATQCSICLTFLPFVQGSWQVHHVQSKQ